MSLDISLYVDVDTGGPERERFYITSLNVTHNVSAMWERAGVYEALYHSDGTPAGEWVDRLRLGVRHMEDHPRQYEKLAPCNGWGSYGGALEFLRKWATACVSHPKARIEVSA